jgi:fructokinase
LPIEAHALKTTSPASSTCYVVALFGEVLADVFPGMSVLGGAPFNVARHIQRFNLHPLLISRTGNDTLSALLLQEMTQLGMNISGIQRDAEFPTGQVQVIIENDGHHFDILPDQAYDHIDAAAVQQTLSAFPPQLAYFGTLALRHEKSRAAAMQFLQHCNCPVFLDINLRTPWYDSDTIKLALEAADFVKLNDEELTIVAGLFGSGSLVPRDQALSLQQHFGLRQVLVTCGERGSWLLDEKQQLLEAAPVTLAEPVVDTVGAGDAFAAVFMLGLLTGWDTATTLKHASEVAAALCRVRGAAAPSTGFFLPFKQDV